jgi:hypothetical protein
MKFKVVEVDKYRTSEIPLCETDDQQEAENFLDMMIDGNEEGYWELWEEGYDHPIVSGGHEDCAPDIANMCPERKKLLAELIEEARDYGEIAVFDSNTCELTCLDNLLSCNMNGDILQLNINGDVV